MLLSDVCLTSVWHIQRV